MIFYNKNFPEEVFFSKIRNFLIFITFIFSIIQIYISNFNFNSFLIVLIIFLSSTITNIVLLNKKIFLDNFLCILIVFPVNFAYLLGPLLIKTFLFQDISSNLYLPTKTFLIAAIYQLILVFALFIYSRSNNLKNISSKLSKKIIFKLEGFQIPSNKFIYLLFFILFIIRFYLIFKGMYGQNLDSYGNIFQKILEGFNLLFYLPLFFNFYLFQNQKISKKNFFILLFFYLISGFLFGYASNSRTTFFSFFFYLFFLIFVFKIFNYQKYIKTFNFFLSIIFCLIILNINFISNNILDKRSLRDLYSPSEILKLSFSKSNIERKKIYIELDLINPLYTNNIVLDRILTINYLDRYLYRSNNFNTSQKKEFNSYIKNRFLTILPQNFIKIFHEDFEKNNYMIATGSLIDRVYNGKDIGGLLATGTFLVEIFLFFDSYTIGFIFIFFLFLFSFTAINSLFIKEKEHTIISPLLSAFLIYFISSGFVDSLRDFFSIYTRSIIQSAILYFLIYKFHKIFLIK